MIGVKPSLRDCRTSVREELRFSPPCVERGTKYNEVNYEGALTWQSKLNHLIKTIVDGPIELFRSIRSQDHHELVGLLTSSEIVLYNWHYRRLTGKVLR